MLQSRLAACCFHIWLFRPIGAHQCSVLTNHSILQCHVSFVMGSALYLCLTKPMTGEALYWATECLLACWIIQRIICTILNAIPVGCRSVTLLAYSFSFSSHWETQHTHTNTHTHTHTHLQRRKTHKSSYKHAQQASTITHTRKLLIPVDTPGLRSCSFGTLGAPFVQTISKRNRAR